MEDPSPTINVLEHCGVSPPADTHVTVTSLPLNFFDLLWLTFHPLGRVIFYDFPYSTSHFIENTVPNLKTSLSLALKHFTPLAGNLIAPRDTNSSTEFLIRCLDGDSVSVTFAECMDDPNHFNGNHIRDANMLNAFVPQLPPATCVDISGGKFSAAPVFAIQVTVFPKRAICIGIRSAHAVADGSSLFNFARAWASITKQVILLDTKDTKLDYYNIIDFGWGKPQKFEFVEEPLSMSRCRDSNADLEIGIVLPKNEMDAFSTIFAEGVQCLHG
ncbi:hypothetical protein POM88_053004 [Heracleum sosnowskyi]|uniref:Anthocyanin acyltransferase n=1 Tax=Heracleum sosnowskyi TaxID=360622 RepID=A0AAD8GR86_9APIA|nr:hypothetical protein POM88_053004 [Heracleum sosnowskyi]